MKTGLLLADILKTDELQAIRNDAAPGLLATKFISDLTFTDLRALMLAEIFSDCKNVKDVFNVIYERTL